MNFKVSVIIPVYNVEEYVSYTIESVIKQSINFKSNVELILVNDGSKDDSEKVCLKYVDKYPNNIKYFYKKNSGVSDTRNFGYEKSSGKYVMFLDADDCINKCSLKVTSEFLDKHEEVDFVISRVRFFDKISKWHYMDYRFKSNKKIVDINENITFCQYHSTGILIRRDAISDIKFDKNIKFGEDMKFMSTLIFKKSKFGIEKKSMLYYRKRPEETSASQTQLTNKSYYLNTMTDSLKWILDESKKRYGYIPDYFKYYVMNSISERFLRSRLEMNVHEILNDEEYKKYIDTFMYILNIMDDNMILMQKRLSIVHKYYILKLLHGKKFNIKTDYNGKTAIINDFEFELNKGDIARIKNIEKVGEDVSITFSINDYVYKPEIYLNGKKTKLKNFYDELYRTEYFDINFEKFYEEKIYRIKCRLSEFESFEIKINGFKVPIYVNPEVISHNTLPCLNKRVGNELLLLDDGSYKVKGSKTIKKLVFRAKNILYIINRDGLIFTIKRAGKVFHGQNNNN